VATNILFAVFIAELMFSILIKNIDGIIYSTMGAIGLLEFAGNLYSKKTIRVKNASLDYKQYPKSYVFVCLTWAGLGALLLAKGLVILIR
jgi:hypothetical protein